MKNKRRSFRASFKAKIAVEDIKEQMTMSELAQKLQLNLNQITLWKNEVMSLPGPLFFNIITTIFVNKLANLTRPSYLYSE